jgi:hypothetical protein
MAKYLFILQKMSLYLFCKYTRNMYEALIDLIIEKIH